MKRMNMLGVAMCCGVMAGLCGAAAGQPVELKPVQPTRPSMPGKDSMKDAMKGAQPERQDATPLTRKPDEMPAEKKAEMEAYMKAAEPGEMHRMLGKLVGTWDATVKMMEPGEPSSQSVGTMTYEMVLGGRYQRGHFKGDMMGMPFEGFATTGYNNTTKMFESTWMDNFSTATMTTKGTMEGDKLMLTGEMTDPVKGKVQKEREVTTFMGNDKMLSEFYHEMDGKDVLVMTINYTRSMATPAGEMRPADKMNDKDAMEKSREEAKKKAMEEMKKRMPTGK